MSRYDLLNYAATAAVFIFNLFHIREKKALLGKRSRQIMERFSKTDQQHLWARLLSGATFWAVMETLLISVLQYVLAPNRPFGELVGTGANYFGLLLTAPVFMAAGCVLMGIDIRRQIDLVTPAYPLALAISKIACLFGDCCGGAQCTFLGGREFPSQLVESLLAALIFAVLLCYRKEMKTGTVFPWYMILYSGTRFFSEFFREEENVLGIFKIYHILCMGGVLLGVAALYFLLREYDRRADRSFFTKSQ